MDSGFGKVPYEAQINIWGKTASTLLAGISTALSIIVQNQIVDKRINVILRYEAKSESRPVFRLRFFDSDTSQHSHFFMESARFYILPYFKRLPKILFHIVWKSLSDVT